MLSADEKAHKKGSWRRISALIIKEAYQIRYDPSSILISIVLPTILLFLYGFGVSLDLNKLKIGLVMEDTSPAAQSFASSLVGSPTLLVTVARDRRELTDMILGGKLRGMVIIPSYFSAFRDRPDSIAPIQVIADGAEPNTANFLQNYVNQAWSNWLQQEHISNGLEGLPLIRIQPRFWFNEQLESRDFLIPGSLAIIMTLIGMLLTSLVIAREWERGTMEALMATPVHISEILIGKMVPYYFLAMLSMTCCVVGARLVYGVPLRGSIFVLVIVTTAFLFTMLGIGLLISTLTKNQLAASQLTMAAGFLPAYMLSGFLFEIASMPMWVQFVTYLLPARYFVHSLLSIFLVGDLWPLLIKDVLVMLLIGGIIYMFNFRLIVKRLD